MIIFLDIIPPTTTAQQHKVRVVNGRPFFYDTKEIKAAKKVLKEALEPYIPEEPITGPIELKTLWMFPCKSHRPGTYRTTRPDTDNIEKILKDVMTGLGYWKDDALVAKETVTKIWAEDTPGIVIEINPLTDKYIK